MFTSWCLIAVLAQMPDRQSDARGNAQAAFRDGIQARQEPAAASFPADSYFREAAGHYESARTDEGIQIPALERTLGHARFLSGDLPRAILAYRRGLRLGPGDAKLETALAYARSRVEYPPSPAAGFMQPEREYWPGWLDLHRLGLLALAAYTVACLALTRWQMMHQQRWLCVALIIAVISLVPAVGSGVEWLRRQRDDATPVVVVVRPEMLRTGNGTEYPPRLDVALPLGAEVRRLFERGGWFQVELSGGPVGWLPRDAVVEEY